ncbi:MAG: hypothetical protein FJ109_16240 [Deltaproteobacteria bacterium]|nr:hypothetical protein [Deltaproteobacteria bacterium]
MAVDFKNLTLDDLLKALPYLVVPGMEGRYVYNLEMAEVDGVRVKGPKYHVAIEGGKVQAGEGHLDEEGATLFTVNQGGVDTLVAFQVYGLKAATAAMIMGYIFASNIKKAEMWFRLLKIGLEPTLEAMKAAGLEPGDTHLDIYAELMVG